MVAWSGREGRWESGAAGIEGVGGGVRRHRGGSVSAESREKGVAAGCGSGPGRELLIWDESRIGQT
jgi:hypothetical protein